jgi:hypothetical protein
LALTASDLMTRDVVAVRAWTSMRAAAGLRKRYVAKR